MDRDIGVYEREDHPTPDRAAERDHKVLERPDRAAASRQREPLLARGQTCRVSPAERQTMQEIGRFRTIALQDLARYRYRGDTAQMGQDLRNLTAQGLIQRHSVWVGRKQGKLAVVVLTPSGKDALERDHESASQQATYAGFVKPAEVAHDAAIYRMYQAEANRIERDGGQIRRIVLDYELKRSVYSPLAKAKGLPPLDYARRQAQVAQANGLKVVKGKIPLPDLRIEYETRDGQAARVDLELATEHYHGSHVSEKAEAGFKIYAASATAARLSAALEEREITAAILSL